MEFDPWSTGKSLTSSLSNGIKTVLEHDPQLVKITAAKKALEVAAKGVVGEGGDLNGLLIKLCLASCNGEMSAVKSILIANPSIIDKFDNNGLTPLIYSICFNKPDIVEYLLLLKFDPNLKDNLMHYTPIMWSVYLNNLDIVKILLNNGSDPYIENDNGKNSVDLLAPSSEIYDYFEERNLTVKKVDETNSSDFYSSSYYPPDDNLDDLTQKLKLQTADLSINEPLKDYGRKADIGIVPENQKDFNYEKLLPDQFIKFTDTDISSLLDYIFKLPQTHKHSTTIPASIMYQFLRYSHLKAESSELTEFVFNLFVTNVRSATNTKSGVFNLQEAKNGDIVLLSYWLAVIQFLYFYLVRDGQFFKQYPHFLQELVTLLQSIIAQLAFSLNNRLNDLVEICMLDYQNIPGIDVLFQKDWNISFFKNKTKNLSNYDDIFDMLYPPTQKEQMKPSPIKIIQTLGALNYVLNLHEVHNLVKLQTFNQVFYWFGSTLFNRLISNKKYMSRSQAIQIRLNLSSIEDWLRSNDFKMSRPDQLGGVEALALGIQLSNYMNNKPDLVPTNLVFYYGSFYDIGRYHLAPFIELLQWLQVMSSLEEEPILIRTINSFDYLNYFQILKVLKLYKYEISEPKFPKPLTQFVKKFSVEQGENLINNDLHYAASKDKFIYLNPDYIFPIAFPNTQELIERYGSGIGGFNQQQAWKYQPLLPIEIMDDVDEIQQQNKFDNNDTFDYDQSNQNETGDEEEYHEKTSIEQQRDNRNQFQGEMYKQVQMPTSAVHRNWGDDDIEANPW